MHRIKKLFLLSLLLTLLIQAIPAQTQPTTADAKLISFEFLNQDIRDILYVFSGYAGRTIIADTTVSGTATFQYKGTDFDRAFDAFLLTNRLFVDKENEGWLVSRVHITKNNDGTINLDAYDATASQLLEKVTAATGTTIIPDVLPTMRISLHLKNASAVEAAELIMKPFTEYEVKKADTYIQIARNAPSQSLSGSLMGKVQIDLQNNLYTAFIEGARLGDAVNELFKAANKEYASFVRTDQIIAKLNFSGKSFEDALKLILEQCNSAYKENNGIWYLLPAQQNEIIQNIQNAGKEWKPYSLSYLSLQEFLPLLQARFPNVATLSLSGGTEFLAFVDNITNTDILEFISKMDTAKASTPIQLKYIRTEDLLKALPPSVRQEELSDAGNGNTVFFTGTKERLVAFLADLKLIDRPAKRIRYDLFIIQMQDTKGFNWNISAQARELQAGDQTMVTGQLGQLLNLNFDVISTFGYQFAGMLNSAITNNKASVFADTTLYGLSGQQVKFENTSTYRYRDYNIDPETGQPLYSGVTREIQSGLVLDISGWVSGDNMITITISASLSKRGADTSSTIGNPPPTSEKTLTTQVRARSGETIVLSGFRQNDTSLVEEGTPGLSQIPIAGQLFKSNQNSEENTQMLIYLVPHADLYEYDALSEEERLEKLYEELVLPYEEI
ncbi:MAG: type II and III secretion system protein [Spirochaetaceae bacterium]|jgi:type II secretory pathway component GspD/PulD (secretin)|nr:type II and III secretion system protein [Spirochaetaceae bacterium]